ncbi:MAG: DUF4184 family protein [Candidatus Bathyarchaeota archaeon]|nr:MAG: DUF4184 family protein [Candidatus Bathyarchaeota archaeon]
MPASPLHFLAIAPLHFKRPDKFDMTALFCSSMAVDLELLYAFLVSGSTTHGFWHSYFFVLTIYPIGISLFVYSIERELKGTILGIYRFFRFFPDKVKYSFRTVYFCCLVGGVSHIFFDMWTHSVSSYVLFPFATENPFWIGEWGNVVFALVFLLSSYTIILWMKQIFVRRRMRQGKVDRPIMPKQ